MLANASAFGQTGGAAPRKKISVFFINYPCLSLIFNVFQKVYIYYLMLKINISAIFRCLYHLILVLPLG